MFASKILFFVLAFVVAFVSSAPTHDGQQRRSHKQIRRTTCPKSQHSGAASSSALASAASSSAAAASSKTPTTIKDVATSSKAEATSTKKTSTSSAAHESATEKSSSSSTSSVSLGSNKLLSALFPVSDSVDAWTTAASSDDALPLSDATLNPTKILSALAHPYVTGPEGKKAMKAHYPKGSYTFGHSPQGGISFYAPGPSSVDLTTAKEATLGYSIYFPDGFDFQKGGKLPGLYGGDDAETAVSCSGGRRDTSCFSARLMWRTSGMGEFYTYFPDPSAGSQYAANKKLCSVAPDSECNPDYGASVGRGAFTFPTGAWTTVSERVKLNDAGKSNGEIELFVNGKSVISVSGLVIRDSSAGRIRGIQMQTFFGGDDTSFASPKDQDVYFADFSTAITEKL